jgi:excisionase family DNA binding protein
MGSGCDPNGPGKLTLTVAEAAKALGVSPRVVYRAVREGTIPAIHIGRRVVIPRGRLLALLGSDVVSGGIIDDVCSRITRAEEAFADGEGELARQLLHDLGLDLARLR